jgi:hypothetical protein
MRDKLAPTRIALLLGMLLTMASLALGQDPPAQAEAVSEKISSVKVGGRVSGEATLQNAEKLVVILLAGWSDTLSSDIAAGMAPMVPLHSGKVEHIMTTTALSKETPWTGLFEFRDVAPGEYQAVALRLKEGAESGAAIAEGERIVVRDRDIANLELAISPLPIDQPGRRHGGAEEREASIIENIGRPRPEPPPVFRPQPPRGPTITHPPIFTGGNTTKKTVLGHIIVGLSIAAAVLTFTKW